MDKESVLNLAKLARIELQNDEAESLSHELDVILDYVGEVKIAKAQQKAVKTDHALKNVMREDKDPHEVGLYTKEILEQAPAREGDYIKVKKIL